MNILSSADNNIARNYFEMCHHFNSSDVVSAYNENFNRSVEHDVCLRTTAPSDLAPVPLAVLADNQALERCQFLSYDTDNLGCIGLYR